tara:strand:- start:113 stop:340 length:228 start_codon:yes stop_codon:yes gene_type:complete
MISPRRITSSCFDPRYLEEGSRGWRGEEGRSCCVSDAKKDEESVTKGWLGLSAIATTVNVDRRILDVGDIRMNFL